MRMKHLVSVALVALVVANSRAALTTNSWTSNASGKWETAGDWSAGTPSLSQSAIVITNGLTFPVSTKVITIDQTTASTTPGSLTISNFTVQGNGTLVTVGIHNALVITNGSANPADVTLTVKGTTGTFGQMNILNRGSVEITNASLVLLNSQLFDDNSFQLDSGKLTTTNTYVYIGQDPNGDPGLNGQMTVLGGTWVGNDAVSVGGSGRGTLTIAGGTSVLSSAIYVGGGGSIGAVWITGGELINTNDFTELGIEGYGQMTVQAGTWLAETAFVGMYGPGAGTLTIAGGVSSLSYLTVGYSLGATGAVWVTGGQLTATNFNNTSYIGDLSVGFMTVSNGAWLAHAVWVGAASGGSGTLTAAGGTSVVLSNLTIGTAGCTGNGTVIVDGGALYVTNGTHTAVLDVEDGSLLLNSGTLVVDHLVTNNPCGHFQWTGGTLVVGGATNTLAPSQITAIGMEGNNVRITWVDVGSHTNVVEATDGIGGDYATNFADISAPIVLPGSGNVTTNYLDVGGSTNKPARYYRVRLAP